MKRNLIIMALCLYSISAFAQISVIQAEKSPFEIERLTKTASICYDKQKGTYELCIHSSNRFEKAYATLILGKSVDEAAASLVNLHAAMENVDTYFNIKDYNFYVANKQRIDIIPSGNIESSVGTYSITSELIGIAIEWLVVRKNLTVGYNCTIGVCSIFERTGYYYVSIPKYNVNNILIQLESSDTSVYNFELITSSKSEGYVLTNIEIGKLKSWIMSGGILHSDDADFILKIADSTPQE